MSISQEVRYGNANDDKDNPHSFYADILSLKPAFSFHSGIVDPIPGDGVNGDVFTNTSSKVQFIKKGGVWTTYLDISAGSVASGANLGGEGIYDSTDLNGVMYFKGLTAGAGVTLTPSGNDITIGGSGINSATNLGTGEGVYANVTPADNLNFRSLVASDNIEITPSALELTLGLSDSLTNVNNITAGALQNFSLNSDDVITLNAGPASTIYMNGQDLNCAGLIGKVRGMLEITGRTAQPLIVSSDQWIELKSSLGYGMDITAANVNFASVPVGLISVVDINLGSTLNKYKVLSVAPSSGFGYSYHNTSVDAVVVNLAVAAGKQFWERSGGVSPAEFFGCVLPTDVGIDRRLRAVSATILHNDVSWTITSGSITLNVGYVAAGLAMVAANITTIYTSSPFALAVSYPTINDSNVNIGTSVPLGARVVTWLNKGPGVVISAVSADVSVMVEFV